MQRILITGGAGYLGAELVRQALAGGWAVAATYYTRRPNIAAARWLELDVRDADAVSRALAEARPDVVVHTAYRQSGPDLWSISAEGAAVVANAAAAAGARLIHMSSDALFDGERTGMYTEADDPRPITPYGEAKAAAERFAAQADPHALIVRTSLLYGGHEPGQHERLVLDVAAGRADLEFFTDELRCPIVVGDLAAALLELAPTDTAGRLHIAGTDIVSRYEFACRVAAAHGYAPERLRAGSSAASGLRRPRNCAMDSGKAQGLVRTRLRGIREVLCQESGTRSQNAAAPES
jgi:dTDP-4-dehydrorhamnose reductase